jgi:hypothetical protein
MPEIKFLSNEAGKVEGLAYAGFETFRGSPYMSCARETGQNSRDAATQLPVSVSFNLLSIPRMEIPFADELQKSIECCLLNPQDKKTKQHLERALSTITAPTVKVLEIADRNTTGLTGPTTDPQSVFAALVKGDGVTNKADATSAGSFGIGKNAAFAVSDLQTVIYSTQYADNKSEHVELFSAQGRLRLISHVNGQKSLSAEGYWGAPGFAAIESIDEVPNWMRRHEKGTSIFSMGFREEPHWIERMTLSLATNFFLAINRKEIEFSVDSIKINHATLESILNSEALEAVAKQTDELEDLHRARRLLECIRSDATTKHKISINQLGDFSLHLLVKEGMPREVHILRNGIYIADNFAKFSEPMRRFPGVREFIAILEPSQTELGKLPSSLLKQLENPAHDSFEPERIVDEVAREKAKKQIKQLIKSARETIRDFAKIEEIDSSRLDELSDLFGVVGSGEKKNDEADPAKFIYGEARRGKGYKPSGVGVGKGGKGKGGGTTHQKAKRSTNTRPAARIEKVRSMLPNLLNLSRRRILFTPDYEGALELCVFAVGLSGDVELRIMETSKGKVSSGRILLEVAKAERVDIEVTLADEFPGPIELRVASTNLREAA